jgi:hypothetical protein
MEILSKHGEIMRIGGLVLSREWMGMGEWRKIAY